MKRKDLPHSNICSPNIICFRDCHFFFIRYKYGESRLNTWIMFVNICCEITTNRCQVVCHRREYPVLPKVCNLFWSCRILFQWINLSTSLCQRRKCWLLRLPSKWRYVLVNKSVSSRPVVLYQGHLCRPRICERCMLTNIKPHLYSWGSRLYIHLKM